MKGAGFAEDASVRLCDFDDDSEVTDDYLFPMSKCIGYSAYPKDRNWPETVFCGDPYELPPNKGSQRLGPYCHTKRLFCSEIMAP